MSVKWSQIKDNIGTGDILLFHGEKSLFSRFIELFTWCQYSHCGMIVKPPIDFTTPPLEQDIYFFQSGESKQEQPEQPHNTLIGVQFTKLEEECKKYKGKVYYRKLWSGISESLKHQLLKEIHDKIHNHKYDEDIGDWICSFLGIDKKPTVERFWCSALVAYCYMNFNLLPKSIDWSMIKPSEFSYINNPNLKLLGDAWLEPEVEIIFD